MLEIVRILSWIKLFRTNCKKQQVRGPLTTSEIENQKEFLIKKEQHRYGKCEKFEVSQQQFNLKLSEEGLYKCYSRIQGQYPIFVPRELKLAEKLIEEAQIQTIHGGLTLTMTKVRSKYSVPTLRQSVKRVLRICCGCKKLHVKRYPVPQKGLLQVDYTNSDLPFKIRGTDYTGSFLCKSKWKMERKVYIPLFNCSLSGANHLEGLPNQTTQEFIHVLKQLIVRSERPKVIYSDKAKTFGPASKWIEKINKDELMQEYLIKEKIEWKFNLARAPKWGGQFEQMVGLVKQCLYKTTRGANLSQKKFEEIVLDMQVTLNNRPLM